MPELFYIKAREAMLVLCWEKKKTKKPKNINKNKQTTTKNNKKIPNPNPTKLRTCSDIYCPCLSEQKLPLRISLEIPFLYS